jgi:hypothetical protein
MNSFGFLTGLIQWEKLKSAIPVEIVLWIAVVTTKTFKLVSETLGPMTVA